MKVLMVCLGNICRSPLAEGILRKKVSEKSLEWQVSSAGTENYHIGNPPFHMSVKVAKENGIDISKYRAEKFESFHIQEYDLIVAMAEDVFQEMIWIEPKVKNNPKVKLLLRDFPIEEFQDVSVPDPYYGGYDGFVKVYEILDQACDKIIEKYLA